MSLRAANLATTLVVMSASTALVAQQPPVLRDPARSDTASLAAQQPRRVMVRVPWEDGTPTTVTVAIGDRVLGTFVISHGVGSGTFDIPTGATISVTARRIGYDAAVRRYTVRESDREIDISFGSKASPAAQVTWKTAGGTADIYVDGHSAGTTQLERQVSFGHHEFEWRRGGNVICRTTEDLPPATTRCFACDPAGHTVTQC